MELLDFKKIIDSRKAIFEKRKAELDKIKNILIVSKAIQFSISDIIDSKDIEKKDEIVGVSQLNFLKNIKDPAIYIYELVNPEIKTELLERIKAFRSKDDKDENGKDLRRATVYIPRNSEKNLSNILYVGSVKKYLHTRTKQHLGLGHPKTYSLQLKHWAQADWQLNFYYILIENQNITTDIEAALTVELNPLVGKRER